MKQHFQHSFQIGESYQVEPSVKANVTSLVGSPVISMRYVLPRQPSTSISRTPDSHGWGPERIQLDLVGVRSLPLRTPYPHRSP